MGMVKPRASVISSERLTLGNSLQDGSVLNLNTELIYKLEFVKEM